MPSGQKSEAKIGLFISNIYEGTLNILGIFNHENSAESSMAPDYKPWFDFCALADGSFAVWDPARNYWKLNIGEEGNGHPPGVSGIRKMSGMDCNEKMDLAMQRLHPTAAMKETLLISCRLCLLRYRQSLTEQLVPGALTRISVDDARDMPTLKNAVWTGHCCCTFFIGNAPDYVFAHF